MICSNKGTFYVLCAPDMVHADPEVAEKYGERTNNITSALTDCSNNFIIIIMQRSRSYSMKPALMHFVPALVSS